MPPDRGLGVVVLAGFVVGTAFGHLLEQLVYHRHPAVVEGETIVEEAAAVIEAERILRRGERR